MHTAAVALPAPTVLWARWAAQATALTAIGYPEIYRPAGGGLHYDDRGGKAADRERADLDRAAQALLAAAHAATVDARVLAALVGPVRPGRWTWPPGSPSPNTPARPRAAGRRCVRRTRRFRPGRPGGCAGSATARTAGWCGRPCGRPRSCPARPRRPDRRWPRWCPGPARALWSAEGHPEHQIVG